MKTAVFDPAVLCISVDDWLSPIKRDQFLLHLQMHLGILDEFPVAQIAWNDELENYFWQNPQPPWRQDVDWNNKLIPWLYWTLKKHTFPVDIDEHSCTVTPQMSCCNVNAMSCFLRLTHEIFRRDQEYLLCLGITNIQSNNSKYRFQCKCCSNAHHPLLICSANDWLHHIDLINDYWPKTPSEIENFIAGLRIVQRRDFGNASFVYSFEFSREFVKDIIKSRSNREKIFSQMVSKLTKTPEASRADASLNDEFIEERNEFRIRITAAARIHYKCEKRDNITFIKYYDPGEHNKGLKKQ